MSQMLLLIKHQSTLALTASVLCLAAAQQGGGGGGGGGGTGGGGSNKNQGDLLTNAGTFLNFESPQVHPISVSADGQRLFAVDTPDARLSVFTTSTSGTLILASEIPVGIEPVSVRERNADEVWVVNHTSDSISVVSLSQGVVTDTIYCKDEPCDVVFGGTPQRAYVTAAGSKAVLVFDAASHALVTSIPLLGMSPRSLAVNADGSKIYAAIALSGNRSTIIPASLAPPPPAPTNSNFGPAPQTGLIVDSADPAWSGVLQYSVADNDVAEISTSSNTVARYFSGVGTINFVVSISPATGDLYVGNTDSHNTTRFEPNLRGRAIDNVVSRINIASGAVSKIDLNPGLDYSNPNNPAAKAVALAQPTDIAFTPDGSAMWVTSFGTDRVAKVDPSTGNILQRVEVGVTPGTVVNPAVKRGPRGLAMQPSGAFLYVMNRISNTIGVINTTTNALSLEVPVGGFDPTPAAIKNGRGFLYDSKLSGNGTMSCGSCHVDADTDREDWDLGDPDGTGVNIPDPANIYGISPMHPMKGPMFTQTLRGLSQGSNPLHWRGDRSDFNQFSTAFQTLLGGTQLNPTDMLAFTNFIMTCDFEPNPNLGLDRTLPLSLNGADPVHGLDVYNVGSAVAPIGACNTCHHLPLGTGSKIVNKTVLGQEQGLKVPQLRTSYMKVDFNNAPGATSVAGFGLAHDGAFSSIEQFLSNPFTFGPLAADAVAKRDLAAFCMCIDTNTAPAVGFSRTVTPANAANQSVLADINMLLSRVAAGEIDLIAKGKTDGVFHGFYFVPLTQKFQSDASAYGSFTLTALMQKIAAGGIVTFMGVPLGSGHRMGIDRDLDGIPDFDQNNLIFLADYGNPTPPCAGNIHLVSNSQPQVGNSSFGFECNGLAPDALSLLLVGAGVGLNHGLDAFGITIWVDLNVPELYALNMPADDLGFGFTPVPIPNVASLKGKIYTAMVITLNPCSPTGLAGSQGAKFKIETPGP